MFFYEVHVFEGGTFLGQYTMHPEINTLPTYSSNGYWEPVIKSGTQVQGNMPLLGNYDLFYINHPAVSQTSWDPTAPTAPTGNKCDSHEVVFYVPPSLNLHEQIKTGGSVSKRIGMGFTGNPFTLWQNCTVDLRVY